MNLVIQNHGPLIQSTNYFDLPEARVGKFLLSQNAGAFRLLVPFSQHVVIPDLTTAVEVVVSRGRWPAVGLRDGFEVLFDDQSTDPFALHLSPASVVPLPSADNVGRPWTCSVWVGRRGKPRQVLERPCWYRLVPEIPWLKPREVTA